MSKFFLRLGWLLFIGFAQPIFAAVPLHIIAAENFYGSVAKEIGGPYVQVTSILSQPDQDPHLFSATPRVAQGLAQADLIIYNGIGYDPWVQNLLSVSAAKKSIICVAELLKRKAGENPHIWYDPATMPIYVKALRDFLIKQDPTHQQIYQAHYQKFMQDQQQLIRLIAHIKAHYNHTAVIATEPVFGYMADALGFSMQGIDFQISMMNDVDPSPKQVAAFQQQLHDHAVKLLFYNKQVSSPLVLHLLQQAKQFSIPVVGVTETQPLDKTYHQWMQDQLNQVEQALNESH